MQGTIRPCQGPNQTGYNNSRPSHVMCVNSTTSVLLQTALAPVGRPDRMGLHDRAISRLIFDNCSQRTYVTYRLCNRHKLKAIGSDNLLIKTFGEETPRLMSCDLIRLAVATRDGMELYVNAYSIPTICSALSSQVLDLAVKKYAYLQGIELTDIPNRPDDVEVDILIGADYYWNFFNGVTGRGESGGPVALQSRLGWILSGPVVLTCDNLPACSVNFTATHVLQIDCAVIPEIKETQKAIDDLRKFWDLETIGIRRDEISVYDQFVEEVRFEEGRYEVSLPFKENHPLLPDNFQICKKRLANLLRRLQMKPNVLHEYNRIIKEQLDNGIIERVVEDISPIIGNHHYLPHHEVIRMDKDTTKTRIVYDASARASPESPSLNDCLYSGPPLTSLIFDILVRFRLKKIAVTADIEKAFLNISIKDEDREFLRFLWVDQPSRPKPNIEVYRFARVVFGLTSSPFLLNATLRHHLCLYEDKDKEFVEDTLRSLYVDDYASGFDSVELALNQCRKIKSTLLQGGFNMRKWISNSCELSKLIQHHMEFKETKPQSGFVGEDDQGYSKFTLNQDNGPCPKVLGISWNNKTDELMFDFKKITQVTETKELTKRLVLSIASKCYDPVGLLSPIVLQFKLLFKKLCHENLQWDDSLDEEFCQNFSTLLTNLLKVNSIPVPRCYCPKLYENGTKIELHVFGDASENAYGTCIYLRCQHGEEVHCNLIASKTRVSPLTKQTMPRLELLACLVSVQLAESINKSFSGVLDIHEVTYWSDSQVALSWIRSTTKEYKQFVQNRLLEIRRLSPAARWKYCSTSLNPADICSRGAAPTDLIDNHKWWNGPDFLLLPQNQWPNQIEPECPEVDVEVKANQMTFVACLIGSSGKLKLEEIISLEKYSRLSKLLRITALVLRFVKNLKLCCNKNQPVKGELSNEEISGSEKLWISSIQNDLRSRPNFKDTKNSLNVFEDDLGVLRCRGSMNYRLAYETNCPILLPNDHPFTELLILKAHETMHNGTQETLVQLRSNTGS